MADNVRDINNMLADNYQQYKNMDANPFTESSNGEWLAPTLFDEIDLIPKISIVSDTRNDVLTLMAKHIANNVQFPVNTAFVHGLACVASAMNKSFKYDYFGGEAPVNLYVVTSQPPSSGKSAINNAFSVPVRIAYGDLNKEQAKRRTALEIKLKAAQAELKANAESLNDDQLNDLIADVAECEEKLNNTPIYKYSVSNATPEALETIAFSQNGIWNIISDEAGAINIMLGDMYNDNATKNADLFLQSWDGDFFSSSRITRKANAGYVRGSIAVIAQDETIKTILKEGERGNGISERFIILREQNLLGMRDHFKERAPNPQLTKGYAELIRDIVFADDTVLKFSDKAMEFVKAKKQAYEPLLADGERYSNSMLRGAVGKMDKQIFKIACVLHVIENFKGGNCPVTVQEDTCKWAYEIYSELTKMYESAAESQGYTGESAELTKILEKLREFSDKGKYQIKIRQLRDGVRNLKIFASRKKGITQHITGKLLPKCEALNYCKVVGENIHISPRI